MYTKISSSSLSLLNDSKFFEPHTGGTPEQLYGPSWAGAYVLRDEYSYYNDEGYSNYQEEYLIHPSWKINDDLLAPFRYMVAVSVDDGFLLPSAIPGIIGIPPFMNYQQLDEKSYVLDDYCTVSDAVGSCSEQNCLKAGIRYVYGTVYAGKNKDIERISMSNPWDESSTALANTVENEHWSW